MESRKRKPALRITKAQLLRKIARLESINDQLQTEVLHVDALLRAVGFEEGLTTLKIAAVEYIALEA